MEESYNVSLAKVIDQFHLETIYLPTLPEDIKIDCARVNRPGLQMVGFYDHYEPDRVQIIMVVKKTSNMPHRPCLTGSLVLEAAWAMGALPKPASLENTPLEKP